jgi:hypothetical protein
MATDPGAAPAAPIAAGLRSSLVTRPQVGDEAEPSSVETSYTFHMDLETFRRVVPILAWRMALVGSPETLVTLTIGFDAVGLLRYADASVIPTVASTLAQQLGDDHSATYHYTLSVDEISGEPAVIDLPASYVPGP